MSVKFATGSVKLASSASYVPGPPISTNQLAEILSQECSKRHGRTAQLIAKRLGIQFRHFCRDFFSDDKDARHTAIDLGVSVMNQLLSDIGITSSSIGYLIGHTTTPATLLPPNTAWVADEIGLENPYMELRQACTGFANALQIAMPLLNDPSLKYVAILGTEAGSKYCHLTPDFMDQEQLVNFVQMGDGAGGVVLSKDDGQGKQIISDIYFGHIGLDQSPAFQIEGGGSLNPDCEKGLPKFSHDVEGVRKRGEMLFEQGINAIKERGYNLDDFDFIIPHQVNGHLAKLLGHHLDISPGKIVVDANELGNMGSAAIWVSLDRLIKSGRLNQGNKVLVLGAEATKYMYGGFVYTH